MRPFVATDPGIEHLLQKVGELWARIASVEQKFHDLRTGAELFAWVAAFLGVSAVIAIVLWVRSLIARTVADRVEKRVTSELKDSVIPRLQAEGTQALRDAANVLAELRTAASSTATQWMIDSGEREVTFNAAYLVVEERFSLQFPVTPQILVGEANAGAWVFVKVDAKAPDKFTWAATILGASRPLPYTTRIQWIAIARRAMPIDATPEKVEVSNAPAPNPA